MTSAFLPSTTARNLDDDWTVVTAQNTDIIPQSESLVANGRQRDGAWYGD